MTDFSSIYSVYSTNIFSQIHYPICSWDATFEYFSYIS